MTNKFKKLMPTKKSIKKMNEFKILKPLGNTTSFWKYDCQSVARGVAAGLGASVIPGFQIFYAAILVIIFRGNIPIALLATLITNPLTIIPIMFFTCYLGSWVLGNGESNCVINKFNWDFSSFHAFWSNFTVWILQFGKAFLIGVPILSVSLALMGYIGTIIIWKVCVFLSRGKR
jgi:uncharacterized protein (DUF2062 family)